MKAMILAAGRGERMRPLTDSTPKPLLHVHKKPLIVWHIEKLSSLGFKDIVINIAHLGYKIPKALGDGSQWGVNLLYSDEQESGALESAGGIIKALPHFNNETFLVINGDIYCDYNFDKSFKLNGNLAHIILVENPSHNPDGDFGLKNAKALNICDKKFTFAGIGYYSCELFKGHDIKECKLAPMLREAMDEGKVSAEIHTGFWHDIGTPQRLLEINELKI